MDTRFLDLLDINIFFAGWCGEIRDVIFSDNGSVTVVYRVTVRGSDGEVWLFFYVVWSFLSKCFFLHLPMV